MTHNLMQEVSLGSDATEREMYDNMGEVYAVVLTLEMVEKAYSQGSIEYDEYIKSATSLIGQFKSNWTLVKNSNQFAGTKLEDFLRNYRLEALLAQRAIKLDRPLNKMITTNQPKMVADITSQYLTFSNYLEMEMYSMEDLKQPMSKLKYLLSEFQILPKDIEAVTIVEKWSDIFDDKSATESLNEEEVVTLKIDIATAQNSFDRFLESHA